jgi:hypothetical protein
MIYNIISHIGKTYIDNIIIVNYDKNKYKYLCIWDTYNIYKSDNFININIKNKMELIICKTKNHVYKRINSNNICINIFYNNNIKTTLSKTLNISKIQKIQNILQIIVKYDLILNKYIKYKAYNDNKLCNYYYKKNGILIHKQYLYEFKYLILYFYTNYSIYIYYQINNKIKLKLINIHNLLYTNRIIYKIFLLI